MFKSYNYFSYKVSMGGGTLKLFMYVRIIILYVKSCHSSEV